MGKISACAALCLVAAGTNAHVSVPASGFTPVWTSFADSLDESRRLFQVARRAFDAKQYEAAADTLTRAAQLNPNDGGIYLWLGNALAQQALRASLPKRPRPRAMTLNSSGARF